MLVKFLQHDGRKSAPIFSKEKINVKIHNIKQDLIKRMLKRECFTKNEIYEYLQFLLATIKEIERSYTEEHKNIFEIQEKKGHYAIPIFSEKSFFVCKRKFSSQFKSVGVVEYIPFFQ